MTDESPVGERHRRPQATSGNLTSQESTARVGSPSSDLPWPWKPEPRKPAPTLVGDIEEAVAFGLAADLSGLTDLTAMICSGIPSPFECTARWKLEDRRTCSVSVDQVEFKLHQTFKRSSDGLVVDQDYFSLPATSRRKGFSKRFARNLAIAYDALGVRQVNVFAGLTDGGIVWARLGARALDPKGQRAHLHRRIGKLAQKLDLDDGLKRALGDSIDAVSDDELMSRSVALTLEDGTPFGELLLSGSEWSGVWDLHDPSLRSYLRDVLND